MSGNGSGASAPAAQNATQRATERAAEPRTALATSRLMQPLPAAHRHLRGGPIEFKARRAPYIAAKAVGSFVPGLTRKTFEKFGFATAQLLTDWADVAGKDVAAYTVPERLRWPRAYDAADESGVMARGGATLMLRVDPARALDIEYKRAQLLERINVYFGYRAVSEIRIVQGMVEVSPKAGPGKPGSPKPIAPVARATPATTPAAQLTVEIEGDAELAQALLRMQANIRARSTAT